MARLSAWLLASGITPGAVFRRINVLTSPPDDAGQQVQRHYIGQKPLTRQGVVAILRRRVFEAIDLGHVELEAGMALALRWSPTTTALRYACELVVGNHAAARVLGRMRAGVGSNIE